MTSRENALYDSITVSVKLLFGEGEGGGGNPKVML